MKIECDNEQRIFLNQVFILLKALANFTHVLPLNLVNVQNVAFFIQTAAHPQNAVTFAVSLDITLPDD